VDKKEADILCFYVIWQISAETKLFTLYGLRI